MFITETRLSVRFTVMLVLTATLGMGCAHHDTRSGLTPQREIEQLKKNQAQLQKDVDELKTLLQQRTIATKRASASQPKSISLNGISFLGDASAPITLVEYTDYHCPFCRRHAKNTLPLLLKQYIETGKIRYGIREFPLEALHPQAFPLAEAALCAGDQDQYWGMHHHLMQGSAKANLNDVATHVRTLGLDAATFSTCMESNRHARQIRSSLASGSKLGVRGTPYFFMGTIDQSNATQLTIASTLRGAQPFLRFKTEIENLITLQKSTNE